MFAGIEELRAGIGEFREQKAQINVSLGRAMLGLTENMDKVTQRMDGLAAAQTEGAERLNALIVVVDGLVRRSQQ